METKITRKLLEDYKKTKREIPVLEYELVEMQTTDSGIGNDIIFDYRDGYPKPQSVVGFDWPLYEHRQKVLERKKEIIEAIEQWINAIEDGQTRCVFRMRYIDDMNWVKIAAKTGFKGNHDYPRLYIRDKYFKESGIK
ncbi:hypothetical protein [Clostridium sp. E02]|uniref:hypothetical protein n=1 Tax=Clostridium sp. E02 TaxID=2487134 RepID=UPI000F543097|nr:hypothetical protein [Clostridium sp. E02]